MIKGYAEMKNLFCGNTTIGIIITNARLSKSQAEKIASMSQAGYGRTMRPAHTMFDGDTIFAISTGRVDSDISVVGSLSARTMEKAVIRAVKEASSLCGFKCHADLKQH